MNINKTLEFALKYLELGFSIIPVQYKKKIPSIHWSEYQKRKPSPEEVKEWFSGNEKLNIGIITGKISNLIVFDIDGEAGQKSLKENNLNIPPCATVQTGKGYHHYFKSPEKVNIKNFIGKLKGIDIKGDGGLIIAPPSIHENGSLYQWLIPQKLEELIYCIEEPPEWLLKLCKDDKTTIAQPSQSKVLPLMRWKSIGARDNNLTKLAGHFLGAGFGKEETIAFLSLVNKNNNPKLDQKDILKIVESINSRENSKIYIPKFCTGGEILKMEFQKMKWLVEGILPEGLAILSGRPKTGKSWLALQLAISIADGGLFLDNFQIEKSAVCYLALEDGKRRLKDRYGKLIKRSDGQQNLFFFTSWPTINDGGLENLDQFLKEKPEIHLVVIDTLQRFRAGKRKNQNDLYADDYDCLAKIKDTAEKYGITILIIHHNRKGIADDYIDEVLGTTGITGAVDNILVLKNNKTKRECTLNITGRDIEDKEIAISFDNLTWSFIGDAKEYHQSELKKEIKNLLKNSNEELAPKDIAERLGKTPNSVTVVLFRMIKDNDNITKTGYGKYKYYA